MASYFDNVWLNEISKGISKKILELKEGERAFDLPFRHLVVDEFLPHDLALECLRDFPECSEECWERSNDPDIEVKMRSKWESEFDIPGAITAAVRILNSSVILKSLSTKLAIQKLIPDPYFTGGGLNVSQRGGLLDVHVDGNYHDATGLHRRANAIWYLWEGWRTEWGGSFGLYDKSGDKLIKEVEPIFNRLVVFDSHDYSFHGLPNPINCPIDNPRKSLILYYYTMAPRPNEHVMIENPHSALWKKRGLKDKRGSKTREFN